MWSGLGQTTFLLQPLPMKDPTEEMILKLLNLIITLMVVAALAYMVWKG